MQDLLSKIKEKKPNPFDHFITLVIILAGVLVGLETDAPLAARYGGLFRTLDLVIVLIFVGELALKMGLEGNRPWRFFVNREHLGEAASPKRWRLHLEFIDFWHVFDFVIVVLCLLPHVLPMHMHTGFLPIFRIARILRLVRLAEELQQLHILVGALLKSLPSIAYICLFMSLHFYLAPPSITHHIFLDFFRYSIQMLFRQWSRSTGPFQLNTEDAFLRY